MILAQESWVLLTLGDSNPLASWINGSHFCVVTCIQGPWQSKGKGKGKGISGHCAFLN